MPQGVNPRQWIQCRNESLAALISDSLGDEDEWLLNFDSLTGLRPWKSDETFLIRFQQLKFENKLALIERILDSVKKTEYV